MNELKKRLDNHVFRNNPFNEQMKESMIHAVLNSENAVKRKKKMPLIAMAAAVCIIFIFAAAALHGSGLFSSASELEHLTKQHPEMEKQLVKLSPEFRKNIKLPTYYPFNIKKVQLDVSLPPKDFSYLPEVATFFYGVGKLQFMHVELHYMPNEKNVTFSPPNPIKLADGTTAQLTLNKNAKIISWFDKKTHIQYDIAIMTFDGSKSYGKEELLKMANSMR